MYEFSLCLAKFCRHNLSHWWILRVFHHVLLSLLGLYFGYFPLRAELFPPDGLLFFLQGRQAVAVFEFVLPAFTAQGGVHLCNGV